MPRALGLKLPRLSDANFHLTFTTFSHHNAIVRLDPPLPPTSTNLYRCHVPPTPTTCTADPPVPLPRTTDSLQRCVSAMQCTTIAPTLTRRHHRHHKRPNQEGSTRRFGAGWTLTARCQHSRLRHTSQASAPSPVAANSGNLSSASYHHSSESHAMRGCMAAPPPVPVPVVDGVATDGLVAS
jgi:hypothetical protein